MRQWDRAMDFEKSHKPHEIPGSEPKMVLAADPFIENPSLEKV